MNASEYDKEALLEDINNEKALLMVPVIVILVILMITGLLGNAMVCFYYGFNTKQTTNTLFIVVLALFDIITCVIAMPIEIVDLRFFYRFENGGACKAMRFFNHFAAMGSVVTLLAIAVDRHRRICHPFKKQLSIRHAKIACAVAVALAVLVSLPSCVFYNAVKVNVSNDFGIELIGSDCTTTKDKEYKVALWVYNGLHFVLFIASVVILVVLYAKIGRVIYAHKQQQKYLTPATTHSSDHVATDSSDLSEDSSPRDERKPAANVITNGDSTNRHSFQLSENTKKPVNQTTKSPDLKTVKYTMIMLVITIVFIMSFLPYLILVIWRIFLGRYEGEVLSDSGLVAFQIGIRSYMLNSVINPITYGFFNPRFSRFFYSTVCRCCARVSRDITSSSSGS